MKRHLDRILELVYLRPWAILPARHKAIRTVVEAHLTQKTFLDWDDDGEDDDNDSYDVVGSVAVIPIEGTILNKCSGLEAACGGFSCQTFRQTLAEVSALPQVGTILLNIDSGGGMVKGGLETVAALQKAKLSKNLVAYSDGTVASQAYYFACQADSIYISASAEAGSIGVYCAYLDQSKAYEQAGYELEVFKGGNSAFKAMGLEGTSLTDEQRAYLQADVDASYSEFVSTVRASRRNVSPDALNGKVFSGMDAVKVGLVDGIVNELDSLIAYLNR